MVREAYYIQRMDKFEQGLGMLFQQLQIVASGDVLHQEVLKDILIEKGITTDTEFKEFISKRLAKIQEEETKRIEEDKKKLLKPTVEETAKIEATSKEAEKTKEKK